MKMKYLMPLFLFSAILFAKENGYKAQQEISLQQNNERPVVIEKNIEIRPIMYVALSYDHKIIDGKDSVSFLKCVKENLEDPRKLFLDL